MAAVTVATQTVDDRSNPRPSVGTGYTTGHRLSSKKHRKFGLITVGSPGDTLATGIKDIVCVAWEPASSADAAAATFQATGIVTITTASGGEAGWLHVWSGQ